MMQKLPLSSVSKAIEAQSSVLANALTGNTRVSKFDEYMDDAKTGVLFRAEFGLGPV
jgi:hypothetical protein